MKYLLLLFPFFTLYGQEAFNPYKLVFMHDIENGFPSSSPNCLIQDHLGFIWIGTNEGLICYDGYKFNQYQHDPKKSGSLPDNFILALCESQDGKIWLGTWQGNVSYFDPKTNQFHSLTQSTANNILPNSCSIRSLLVDSQNNLWINTTKGIFIKDSQSDALRKFDLPETFKREPDNRTFTVSLRLDSNNIWISTHASFLKYNTLNRTFKSYSSRPANESEKVFLMNNDSLDNAPILINSVGLHIYIPENDAVVPFQNWQAGPNFDDIIVYKALIDKNFNLWLSTTQGIYCKLFGSTLLQKIYDETNPNEPRPSQRIFDMIEDASGVLWFATAIHGLIKIDPSTKNFGFYYPTTKNNSLSSKLVWSFAEASNGAIWVGTEQGLDLFHPETGFFEHHLGAQSHLLKNGNRFLSILPLSDQELIIGYQKGYLRYYPQKREVKAFKVDLVETNNQPNSNNVYAILKDNAGLLWMGTDQGIHRINSDGSSTAFLSKKTTPSLSRDMIIYKIKQGENNTLWIASQNMGLVQFHPQSNTYTSFRKIEGVEQSLSHDFVLDFLELSPRQFWITTAGGGLNLLDMRGNNPKYRCFTKKDGLPENILYGLASDAQGNLWISSLNGLTKFDPNTFHCQNYTAQDGLQSNEFSSAAFKDRAGFLYFGGVKGFNRFLPTDIKPNPHHPNIVLTNLSIMGENLNSEEILIRNLEQLRLNYRQYLVEFQFAALDFRSPERNKYAYRFNGRDDKWIEIGNRREISFNHLESGFYKFEVRASNNDGIWSPSIYSLDLFIDPPPWRTWWAYVIYGFLALSLSLLYANFKSRRIELALAREREFKEELDRQVKARTRELEQANMELIQAQKQLVAQEKNASMGKLTKGIAHEIRNPLNFINNFALVAQDLAKELQETLMVFLRKPTAELEKNADYLIEELKENSQLIEKQGTKAANIVSMLLEHSRSMGGELQFINLNNFVTEYVPLAIQSLDNSNRYLPVELDIRLDPKVRGIHMFSNDMARVLLNILDNSYYALGLKAKSAPKEWVPTVQVSTLDLGPQFVGLLIRDNGIGIEPEIQSHVFIPLFTTKAAGEGTGLGLSITREIIQDVHGGSIELRSEPGQFTEIEIRLPRMMKEKNPSDQEAQEA